jgi:hypothetical protein
MATRSAIAIETGLPEFGPGVIHAVYCHWDGYVLNNGALLLEHFNSLRIASELIKGGSISSLGEGLDKTEFHHRDMGREMVPASEYGTREEFIEDSNGLEYLYILNQNDAWEVFDMDKPWRGWELVKDALAYELKFAKAA